MEYFRIGLLTEDIEYGYLLSKAIGNVQKGINIEIIEKIEKLNESNKRKMDFYLIDYNFKNMVDFDELGVPYGIITDKEEEALVENGKFIYKFWVASRFIGRIVSIYNGETAKSVCFVGNYGKCEIFAVSSACGGVGVSTLAYALAKEYAIAIDGKVLYLTLGEFHGEHDYFKMNKGLNLKDLIYKMTYEINENNIPYVESYITKNQYGIRAFNLIDSINILNQIDDKTFYVFLDYILNKAGFSKIVVDLGKSISNNSMILRKIAHKNIFVIGNRGTNFEEKIKNYIIGNSDDYIFVKNNSYQGDPRFDEFFEDENFDEVTWDIEIPEEKEAIVNNGGVVDINIDRNIGKSIKGLVNYMANTSHLH